MGISPSRSKGCQVEQVPGPGVERDEQPVAQVVAVALVDLVRARVLEPPRAAAQVVPRQRDVARRGGVAEVHDDELARAVVAPAPDDEALPGVVAPPPAAVAELPLSAAEDGIAERGEEALVERAEVGVGLLVGPAGEEDGRAHPAPVELSLVDEPRAGLTQRR